MATPHYHVEKTPRGWMVRRIDQPCTIASPGTVKGRREALTMARLLAGWRGLVTIAKGKGKPRSVFMGSLADLS
jgi:hypothetical protein